MLDPSVVLKNGGIVAMPTEAVYGLHCDPRNEAAIRKILRLKKRDANKGFILIASDWAQLQAFIKPLPAAIEQKLKDSWPGPITWVVPAQDNISPLITGAFDTVAVRITEHPIVKNICAEFGSALISTSANISDESAATTAVAVADIFTHHIDLIIEGPLGQQSKPTSILDAFTDKKLR